LEGWRFQKSDLQGGKMMSKSQIRRIVLVSTVVVFGLALETSAQTPGAYRLVPNDDPESLAAAKFAIREEGQKLGKTIVFTSMVYAQRQIVSGTNYKLCLKVKVNGTSKRAETVVYRNLQKQYNLTSWKWGECAKPADLKTSTPASPSEKP
jgi:Aspartic acid proteinase inhibitor